MTNSKSLLSALCNIAVFLLLMSFLLAVHRYSAADLLYYTVQGDEAHTVNCATQILNGKILYRDFFAWYTPYWHYLHALLFKLFGIKLSIIRKALAINEAIGIFAAFLIGRRIMPTAFALLACCFALSWGLISYNIPYASWYASTLGLLGLLCLIRHLEKPDSTMVFLAGAFSGMVFAFKLNNGFFCLTSFLLILASRDWLKAAKAPPPAFWGRAGRISSGAYIGLVGILTPTLLRGHLNAKNLLVFELPILAVCVAVLFLKGRYAFNAEKSKDRVWLSDALILGLGFLCIGATWIAPLSIAVGIRPLIQRAFLDPFLNSQGYYEQFPSAGLLCSSLAIWLGAIFIVSMAGRKYRSKINPLLLLVLINLALVCALFYTIPRDGTPRAKLFEICRMWLNALFYPGILCTFLGVAYIIRHGCSQKNASVKQNTNGKSFLCAFALMAYHNLNFLIVYPFSESGHLAFTNKTLFLLMAWGLYCMHKRFVTIEGSQVDSLWARGLAALPVLALAGVILLLQGIINLAAFTEIKTDLKSWSRKPMVLLSKTYYDVYVPQKTATILDSVIDFAKAHDGGNRELFDFPTGFYNYLLDKPVILRWDWFLFGSMSPDMEKELARQLEQKMPETIILRDFQGDLLKYYEDHFPSFYEVFRNKYAVAEKIHPYLILKPIRPDA